jgi:hypothetical protein
MAEAGINTVETIEIKQLKSNQLLVGLGKVIKNEFCAKCGEEITIETHPKMKSVQPWITTDRRGLTLNYCNAKCRREHNPEEKLHDVWEKYDQELGPSIGRLRREAKRSVTSKKASIVSTVDSSSKKVKHNQTCLESFNVSQIQLQSFAMNTLNE